MQLTAQHPDWVLGFSDETWWSRLAHPSLHTWTADAPLHPLENVVPRGDPDPKALCCYGLLRTDCHQVLLRFVEGRPVSHVTTAFLSWLVQRLAAERKRVLVLIWDNASWHISQEVRRWIRAHNQHVKRNGGVRLLTGRLPVKSPWLNPLEPHWVHGKRAIVEPHRVLTAAEVVDRVYGYFATDHVAPLQQHVA
jgi:DDE superfamily endonuclease